VTEQPCMTQAHLIALHTMGLLKEMPYELGPMPVINNDPHAQGQLRQDLIDWNVIDPATGDYTRQAAPMFRGLTEYKWALWGIVLLYNERKPMDPNLEIPGDLRRYLRLSYRDIPRVTFMICVHEHGITTVVLAGGRITITLDEIRINSDRIYDFAGNVLLNILNPQGLWQTYPFEPAELPAATASDWAEVHTDDPKEIQENNKAFAEKVAQSNVSAAASEIISEFRSKDNVASAQICLNTRTQVGRQHAANNAAGIMFFANKAGQRGREGMVVSYPRRAIDRRMWIKYEPATIEAVGRAVAGLHAGIKAADRQDVSLN